MGVGKAYPLGCHVNHSFPSSVEAKNAWSYTSTSRTCLHGVSKSNYIFRFLHYPSPILHSVSRKKHFSTIVLSTFRSTKRCLLL